MTRTILQIDSSARKNDSLTRQVTDYISEQLSADSTTKTIHRDLVSSELPLITEAHIGAYYTKPDERSDEQKALLAISDHYISELKAANYLVIGAPMYNFSVTASLKAWIDLVCRVGETFTYTENGPQGLLNIDTAYIVVAAGGTAVGSDIDFNSGYLKQVCRFIGINDIHIIDVSGSKRDPDTLIDFAKQQVRDVLETSTRDKQELSNRGDDHAKKY